MKPAIYTFPWNRIAYTKKCIKSVSRRAETHPYDLFVLANGCTDGTFEWLTEFGYSHGLRWAGRTDANIGLPACCNKCLQEIQRGGPYNYVVRIINDAEVRTDGFLNILDEVFTELGKQGKLGHFSAHTTGMNNNVPRTGKNYFLGGVTVGPTQHAGGLFLATSWELMKDFQFPPELKFYGGDDTWLSRWAIERGALVGYIEDITIHHIDTSAGQAKLIPEYFIERKKEAPRLR